MSVQRISGPDPPSRVTPDHVRVWLRVGFQVCPTTAVYSARGGALQVLTPNVAPATFDWIAFAVEVLGRRSRECLYLLTWSRAEARRYMIAKNAPNPPGGGTVADFCREFDLERRTFDRTVERACEALAAEWNRRAGSQGGKAA